MRHNPAAEPVGPRSAIAWTLVILGPLVVSGMLVAFRGESFAANVAVVFVLPVLAAAIVGGRAGGASSAVVAALCFDFFFTRPYYSLTISNAEDVATTIVLLVVGLVVGEIVVRTRRSRLLETASRREVDQVRRVAELAAGGGPAGRLISIVEREVVELLGGRGARFERPPYTTMLLRLGHGMFTVPPAQGRGGRQCGPRNEVEIPVWGNGREVGRLVVVLLLDSTMVSIGPGDRALATTLADQLGAVLAAAEQGPTATDR